jgi:HK97 gp10 family phage protein
MTVLGATELRGKFQALANEVRWDVLEEATEAGAEVIAERARELAPVMVEHDPRRRPGMLRAAIRVRALVKNVESVVFEIGVIAKNLAFGSGEDLYWARFVEFGHFIGLKKSERKVLGITRAQGRARQKQANAYVPAQPFLRPALAMEGKHAAEVIRQKLMAAIDRIWTRGS